MLAWIKEKGIYIISSLLMIMVNMTGFLVVELYMKYNNCQNWNIPQCQSFQKFALLLIVFLIKGGTAKTSLFQHQIFKSVVSTRHYTPWIMGVFTRILKIGCSRAKIWWKLNFARDVLAVPTFSFQIVFDPQAKRWLINSLQVVKVKKTTNCY